jgi:hypothetical protein
MAAQDKARRQAAIEDRIDKGFRRAVGGSPPSSACAESTTQNTPATPRCSASSIVSPPSTVARGRPGSAGAWTSRPGGATGRGARWGSDRAAQGWAAHGAARSAAGPPPEAWGPIGRGCPAPGGGSRAQAEAPERPEEARGRHCRRHPGRTVLGVGGLIPSSADLTTRLRRIYD